MANLVQQYLLQQQAGLLAQERQMMEQALMAQMYAQRDEAAADRQAARDIEAYRRAELMQRGMEERQNAQAKVASERQTTHDRDMMDRQAQFLREKDASDMFARTAEPRKAGETADDYIARTTPIRKERTQQAMAEYMADVEASSGRMSDLWKRMDQATKKESDMLYAASAGKINETIEMRAGMLPNSEDLMKKAAAKKQTLAQYLADKAHPLVDEVQSEFRAKAQNDAAAKASPELRYQWQEEYKNAENSRTALKQFKMQNSAWLPMGTSAAGKSGAGATRTKAAAPAATDTESAASDMTQAVAGMIPEPSKSPVRFTGGDVQQWPENEPEQSMPMVVPPPTATQPEQRQRRGWLGRIGSGPSNQPAFGQTAPINVPSAFDETSIMESAIYGDVAPARTDDMNMVMAPEFAPWYRAHPWRQLGTTPAQMPPQVGPLRLNRMNTTPVSGTLGRSREPVGPMLPPPIDVNDPDFVGPRRIPQYPSINPDLSGALGPVVPMPQPQSNGVNLRAEWAKTPEQFGLVAFRRWLNQQRNPTPTGMVEPPALEIPPPPVVKRAMPPSPDAMAWMITYGTPEQKEAVRATYAPPVMPSNRILQFQPVIPELDYPPTNYLRY